MAYGELGPTHHSIEDLSWMRAIADLAVVVPADPAQTAPAVRWAAAPGGPSTCASPRFKVPGGHAGRTRRSSPAGPSSCATATTSRVIAIGTLVSRALGRRRALARRGHRRPRAQHALRRPAGRGRGARAPPRETGGIVTAEEATVTRRARRRGGRASSPAPARARCGSSACTGGSRPPASAASCSTTSA